MNKKSIFSKKNQLSFMKATPFILSLGPVVTKELLDDIRESGGISAGCKKFAGRYGINHRSVIKKIQYFFKNHPEISKMYPRERRKGIPNKLSEKHKTSLKKVLLEVANGSKSLRREDIQNAATKAGVHYHTALSTWGSLIANSIVVDSKQSYSNEDCVWLNADSLNALYKSGISQKELSEVFGMNIQYVRDLISTSKRFPKEARKYPLSFCHYLTVRCREDAEEWLQLATSRGWNTKTLTDALTRSRSRIKKSKNITQIATVQKDNPEIDLLYVRGLYEKIALLEEEVAGTKKKLAASRKVALAAMNMLQNKKLKTKVG